MEKRKQSWPENRFGGGGVGGGSGGGEKGRKGGRRAITNDLTPDGRGSLSGEIRIVNFLVRQRAELKEQSRYIK